MWLGVEVFPQRMDGSNIITISKIFHLWFKLELSVKPVSVIITLCQVTVAHEHTVMKFKPTRQKLGYSTPHPVTYVMEKLHRSVWVPLLPKRFFYLKKVVHRSRPWTVVTAKKRIIKSYSSWLLEIHGNRSDIPTYLITNWFGSNSWNCGGILHGSSAGGWYQNICCLIDRHYFERIL